MNGFWSDYPQIANNLEEVSVLLSNRPHTGLDAFDVTLKDLFSHAGKMLRPAFVLVGALSGDKALQEEKKSKVLALAASIEMLHMATLVHDDIIDEAKLRRGAPSIQSKYGKDYAVYTGDFLLCQSLLMMSQYTLPQDLLVRLAGVMQRICLSEMRQFEFRYHFDLSMKNYFKIISGKTAALFASSLASGAHAVEAPEAVVKRMGRIGYAVGMCFQIQDDILDLESTEKQIRKDILSDLAQGYVTLPILFGLKSRKQYELKALLAAEPLDAEKIAQLLKDSGAIQRSRELAAKYMDRAVRQIELLPEGDARNVLGRLITQILDRVH